jgi:hypothetical protein
VFRAAKFSKDRQQWQKLNELLMIRLHCIPSLLIHALLHQS